MATAPQPNTAPLVHHIQLKPPSETLTPLNLLELALRDGAAIDIIERLAALQEKTETRLAEIAFDDALNRCQALLTRISADGHNPSTGSRYATYAKLDATIRPIYTAEGFSLSFGERDCPTPGKTRFVAYLRRAGVTREYLKDMSPSTAGPKGNDVMTPIHADASADSYAKRYLLKDIFNIAIGDADNDGNGTQSQPSNPPLRTDRVEKWRASIASAPDRDELGKRFRTAYQEASVARDRRAQTIYIAAQDARRKELR